MGESRPDFAPTQIGVLLERYPIYIGVIWEGSKPFDQTLKLGHASVIKLYLGDPICIGAWLYSTNMVRCQLLLVTHTSFGQVIVP